MTVVRGDAARSLIARTQAAGRHRTRAYCAVRRDGRGTIATLDSAPLPTTDAADVGDSAQAPMLTAAVIWASQDMGRPVHTGCVEWVLAASGGAVEAARGMPRSMVRELAEVLETRYGTAASKVAAEAAAATRALLGPGATGRLRLSATRSQLLVELISRQRTSSSDVAADDASGTRRDPTRGSYRTFAEAGSELVTWVALPLPQLPEISRESPREDPDVWT